MKVKIESLTKKYGSITAVDDIDITANSKELTTLVGPSGCGKTTTLRCIAGLEQPTAGRITIGDEVVNDSEQGISVAIQNRNVGFVFQNFDVWTHMSVFDNVAFPLRIRDYSNSEIEEKVQNILELANILELKDKSATDLSGGQQARVGICRALVYEPKVLLCDEPLTGLDRNLRRRLRYEIRQLQSEIGITTVYVTHSQPEAMTMSDKICLMSRRGTVEQSGTSTSIYTNPKSKYSFEFFGTSEILNGKRNGSKAIDTNLGLIRHESTDVDSDDVIVGFRPEEVEINSEKQSQWKQNVWRGTVEYYSFIGDKHELGLAINGVAIRSRLSRITENLKQGDNVFVHIDPASIHLFEEKSE